MTDTVIKVDCVKKRYRLGSIGGRTLKGDIQSWIAQKFGKEDPTLQVGSFSHANKEFLALNNVSFEIKAGERVGIIGINGAGKSTLLKILSRVTAPTDGEVRITGKITSMLEIGTGFHGELSGRENIYLNGAILGMKKNEIDAVIDQIIEFSECAQFIDTPVKRYSSGMYVKLAFSVAAHLNSNIMIMDEVLAVGDVTFQRKCLDKMAEVSQNEGKTILYVSHNMETIRRLCDRCIVLEKGKIVFDGDVERAIKRYLNINDAFKSSSIVDSTMRDMVLNYDMTLRAQVMEIEMLQPRSNYIEARDKFRFRVKYRCNDDVKRVFFRCIINKTDGSPAGTAMSEEIVNYKRENVKDVEFEFDSSQIAPGRYSMTLILFNPTNNGTHEKFDAISNALVFEVIATKGQFFNYVWPASWGNTAYTTLRMLEEK